MGTLLWIIIAVAVLVAWLLGIFDIFRRRLDAKHTIAWLLLVLILPIVGTIIYWVIRPPDEGDFERAEAAQRELRHERHDQPFDSTGFGR